MFAIVDIETTGGHAAAHGITEIAIVLHDGKGIVDQFTTLINPNQPIPYFIQSLTGITDAMVAKAPQFETVADEIFKRLNGAVFVAHNVNFDYSFVMHYLSKAGFDYQSKKLCTVRLARKIIPGLASYSLGKLCRQLDIEIQNRHRALGDAYATAQLLNLLLEKDKEGHITESLKKISKEHSIPPHLSADKLLHLPASPGVYYFYNQAGKVIYVGKAKNLKKRVNSHFSNNSTKKQKQDFIKDIHNISYEICGTELMAILLESTEIKRLWPAYNRSQKHYEPAFGIYDYEDQNGYIRLCIDKLKPQIQPLITFRLYADAVSYIHKIVGEFELCPKLCGAQDSRFPCVGLEKQMCKGACEHLEQVADYNQRVQLLIDELMQLKPTYAVKQKGRNIDEQSYLLVEQGKFYGMGYVTNDTSIDTIEDLKEHLKPLKENFFTRQVITKYAESNPDKVLFLKVSVS